MIKACIRISIMTAVMVCSYLGVFAQVPPNPDVPEDIPVTGIEWLLIGGGLWGAKKIYDGRKKEK